MLLTPTNQGTGKLVRCTRMIAGDMGANEGQEEKLNTLSQREVSELEFPSLEGRKGSIINE